MWYPAGTEIILNYSEDMTNLTGYYQSVNVSTSSESSWQSNSRNKTRSVTLQESYTYRVKIQDKAGRESKVVEKKINIMPNVVGHSGVPTNYYKYNMNGIYPVYIKEGSYVYTSYAYGTNNYYSGSAISAATVHMGLINITGSYTTESKLLYIRLVPCPEEGYISSTRNGITSGSYSYSSGYYGFEFVTLDGKEIKAPSLDGVTTTSGENEITITATTTAYNGASISKYYFSIDNGDYIETTSPYYTFKNLETYSEHTIKTYAVDTTGAATETKEFKTMVGSFPEGLNVIKLSSNANMTSYNSKTNEIYGVLVTASNSGSLWGTEIYTSDSTVAKAVIHMGLAQAGETVLVKIQMLPGQSSYVGTTQNGITSSSYGSYSASYKVLGLAN